MKIIVKIIKIIIRLICKILSPLRDFIIHQNTRHLKLDLNEVFIHQNLKNSPGNEFNRLDIVVRYLAVEEYYGLNNYGFSLYAKMQDNRIEKGYSETAVNQFKKLIASYQTNGYDESSEIELDSRLMLIDGSHRLALGLFHNEQIIACKVRPDKQTIMYGLEWFFEHGFSIEEMNLITNKCEELIREKCQMISCVLWPPVIQYFDEITEKLKLLYEVRDVCDYNFSEETFQKAVQGIYCIDDIEDWKIEKKIQGMHPYDKTIRIIELAIYSPGFRLKKGNNKTISTEGEKLKRLVRNCYKDKVDNYFYDVIIHTGDNYLQSGHIVNLFKPHFILSEYFATIESYSWILIKSDTEDMDSDFRVTHLFSKDIDLICYKNEFDRIVDETIAFSINKCMPGCVIKHIKDKNRSKIRIEQNDFLIFQFDIACEIEYMETAFLQDAVNRRISYRDYYIPTLEDELIFRVYEYLMHPEKIKHKCYIDAHKNKWNIDRAQQAMPGLSKRMEKV